jgi:ATP-dependent Clp endopeptidase proteolytic subunit ClpP
MMSKIHDDIETFFSRGIHIPSSTLYLGSVSTNADDEETGTDFAMAERAIKGLHILDQAPREITVVMNNDGGSVYHGAAIYDAIAGCENRVTVIGTGSIMSMGVIILQAADRRILTPSTRLMVHVGTAGTQDHLVNLQRYADEVAKMDRWAEDILLARIQTKHPTYMRAKLRRLCMFDSYLSAQEAVELGLADEVCK